jgi:hypothetical protein
MLHHRKKKERILCSASGKLMEMPERQRVPAPSGSRLTMQINQ